MVFENGNEAPTEGRNSIFILVFADTAGTLKAISIRSLALIEFALVAPFNLVVKMEVVAVVPCARIMGEIVGVEKTILMRVKSTGAAPGASPIENLISSIPVDGLEASP